MRFRGLLADGPNIQTFVKVLQSFSKFSETFLFRLSENELQLLNDVSHTSPSFVVKCLLKTDDFFEEYTFRGISSDNNLICFRLRSESLSQVMSSLLPHIKALKLRLSKSSVGSATDCVLSVGITYPTNSDSDRHVCHQIKIDIIRSEEWNENSEQDFHSFDLSLYLPESGVFTTSAERLSVFCHYIEIEAQPVDITKAFLRICVETDSISLKSTFSDLEINTNEDNDSEPNVSQSLVAVRIDVRKVNLIFGSIKHLKPTSITCDITDKNRICFQFFHTLAKFQAFLPNIEL